MMDCLPGRLCGPFAAQGHSGKRVARESCQDSWRPWRQGALDLSREALRKRKRPRPRRQEGYGTNEDAGTGHASLSGRGRGQI
jgi:hypothetical protein